MADMTQRTAVVTGGAGFLGSHLVEELVRRKWRVRVVDDLSTGHKRNLSAVRGRVRFARASILDAKAMDKAFSGADAAFHMAAKTSVAESFEKPELYARVNVAGLIHSLEAARRNGVKRFIFPSSASVYSDEGPTKKTEKSPLRPTSPYAVTKVLGEALCRVYFEDYRLQTVSLRFFNIYGSRQDSASQYASVIPKFIDSFARGKRPVIFGDGEQTRDFVNVDDAVNAAILAAERKGVGGEVFNVASGKAISIIALLDAIKEATSSRVRPKFSAGRKGEVRHSCANVEKAKRMLGFGPKVSLREGIAGLVGQL